MATYAELLVASENDTLKNKVRVACVIAAEKVRTAATPPTNQAARLTWARKAFDPDQNAVVTKAMLWAILAQNATLTLAQITGASDAAVQTAVDAAVDAFAV
jgi:hypothetical protein